MKNIFYSVLLSLTMLFLSACDYYHVGSLMHPQIKSIAIGDVINDTAAYNASYRLKQLLAEEFMTDGSLELANRRVADAIIFARIISVGFSSITNKEKGDGIKHPIEWRVRVVVEYSAIVPGEKNPLVKSRVNGEAYCQATANTADEMRQRAIMMACRNAAQKIVQSTVEAW